MFENIIQTKCTSTSNHKRTNIYNFWNYKYNKTKLTPTKNYFPNVNILTVSPNKYVVIIIIVNNNKVGVHCRRYKYNERHF